VKEREEIKKKKNFNKKIKIKNMGMRKPKVAPEEKIL
jgi:hypothetical protein